MKSESSNGFGGREILFTVVILVAVAVSLAIPAVRKVQASRTDTTVLCNIRQLSAAADQYFLEYNVTVVEMPNLVGPDKYLRALATVDRETYPPRIVKGLTITVTGISGARTVTYAP